MGSRRLKVRLYFVTQRRECNFIAGLWFRCYRPDSDSLLRCEINTSTSLRLYIIRDLMTTSLFLSISSGVTCFWEKNFELNFSVVFIVNPFKSVDIMQFVSHHTYRIYITLLALSGEFLSVSHINIITSFVPFRVRTHGTKRRKLLVN